VAVPMAAPAAWVSTPTSRAGRLAGEDRTPIQ
jgi:hypothetical protein